MSTTTDILNVILSRLMKKREVVKIVKIEQLLQRAREDSNTFEISRFRIKILLISGAEVMKYCYIKNLPSDQAKLRKIFDFGYFINEIVMYRDLIPLMETIMIKSWDVTEPVWGRTIDCAPHVRIAMEDLWEYGYEHCRDMDVNHALTVVDGLAKFHALSVALKEKRRIPFDIFGVKTFEKHLDMLSRKHQVMFEDFLDYSEVHWGPDWLPLLSRLERFVAGNITELIFEEIENPRNKFAVLNHGDLRKTNLLFKYEYGSDHPVSMKFIDFQKTGFRSPAFDLQYFFSTTTNTNLRKKYKKIIRAYHSSLVSYMYDMGCSTRPITLKKLMKEVRNLQIYGIFVAVTVLPKILDKENSSDRNRENRDESLTRLYGGGAYTNFMQYLLGKFEMNSFNKDL